MAFDEQLRGVDPSAVLADAEMDVGGAAGVGDGFDRAEIIAAIGTGEEAAVALEVFVAMVVALIVRVQINAVGIDLPDFDERIRGPASPGGGEDAAGQMRDVAEGGRGRNR